MRTQESYIPYIPDLRKAPKVKQQAKKAVVDLVVSTALKDVYEQNLMNLFESYLGVPTKDVRLIKSLFAEIIFTGKSARIHLKTNKEGALTFYESRYPFPRSFLLKVRKSCPGLGLLRLLSAR
jgi:hypothetical protein